MPPASGDQNSWIEINPITIDGNSLLTANRTGQLEFTINGITSYPPSTFLIVEVFDETHSHNVPGASSEGNPFCLIEEGSGTNTFNCTFHIEGVTSANYSVSINPLIREINGTRVSDYKATTWFAVNIQRNDPFVSIDPVAWTQQDQVLKVTGTTNFPQGTNVSIASGMLLHPCPTGAQPDTGSARTLCGGSCSHDSITGSTEVIQNSGGENVWIYSMNTTGWCPQEYYFVTARITRDGKTVQDTDEFSFTE